MYANVTTWRVAEEIRAGEGLDHFLAETAPQVVPLLAAHGLIAAYAVRIDPETALTVNIYTSADDAAAALDAAGETLQRLLAGRLELVARQAGAVSDLRQLAG